MAVDSKALYNALRELQVIPESELGTALSESQESKSDFAGILLEKNLISEENIAKVTADLLSVPFMQLHNVTIPKEILTIIPEIIARQQNVIAYKKDQWGLHVAMVDPTNKEIIAFLESKIGMPLVVSLATKEDIITALSFYMKDISQAFADAINESISAVGKGSDKEAEPPIIKIVDTIITYGFENKASDIHLEPEEAVAVVRFRIDGILHDIIQIPQALFSQIVTRVKVLAKLRTDEHQTPQDGKIEFVIQDLPIDIRVSLVPVLRGEKVVMRLLSDRARQITLTALGFSQVDLQTVKKAYEKPYGMILSTGPTGSGKTTTMYAILKLLNNRNVNIMTIEDPIEYDIEGVNQMQVNQKTDMTFANGLRSILRQDPNIVLVGEIRDEETAGIAINAAMTGHLVLSTLHTNDAATAVPRLLDMGIEPFIVSSTVTVIIGQRLVRRIHPVCRVSEEVPIETLAQYVDKEILGTVYQGQSMIRIYKGKGCPLCHNTGYEGRIGLFEVMEVSQEIQKAIVGKQDAGTIKSLAVAHGMKTMLMDGLSKIRQGETTIEEVLRVTKE